MKLSSAEYTFATTISASIPTVGAEFGIDISLVLNGTTIIMAAGVPNIVFHMLMYLHPKIMVIHGYILNLLLLLFVVLVLHPLVLKIHFCCV